MLNPLCLVAGDLKVVYERYAGFYSLSTSNISPTLRKYVNNHNIKGVIPSLSKRIGDKEESSNLYLLGVSSNSRHSNWWCNDFLDYISQELTQEQSPSSAFPNITFSADFNNSNIFPSLELIITSDFTNFNSKIFEQYNNALIDDAFVNRMAFVVGDTSEASNQISRYTDRDSYFMVLFSHEYNKLERVRLDALQFSAELRELNETELPNGEFDERYQSLLFDWRARIQSGGGHDI